jgi:cysteine desulfurase/selenocysteine lyase
LSITAPAYDLEALRALFPHTQHLTFLNHAGSSPLSLPVKQAMREAIDFTSSDNTTWWGTASTALDSRLRANLAGLINARPEEIALAPNCDKEFPSNVLPWMNLARREGLELRIAPPDCGGLTVDSLARLADENTLLVSVSSVQFLSGYRADLPALGAFCRERGILFGVDAVQSAGHIPLDVQAAHIDFLAAAGFKSLMGPLGIGFLYVRGELLEEFDMPVAGGGSVTYGEVWCDYGLNFLPGANRYELGSGNWIGVAGLDASLQILLDLGVARDAWTTHLLDVLLEDLARRGFSAITPRDPAQHGPIVTFAVPGDPQAALQRLAEQNIAAAVREGHIRISSHCYNTEADVLRVGEVLAQNGGSAA